MKKLAALGYDGPVTPEPFSKRVNALEDPREAAALTAEYMDAIVGAAGLGWVSRAAAGWQSTGEGCYRPTLTKTG